MKKIILLLCLFFISGIGFSQVRTDSLYYVLIPFYSVGLDEMSVMTSESILRMELEKLGIKNLMSEQKSVSVIGKEKCSNTECAIALAEQLNADRVIFCRLNPLGEKIIVQYYLIDVKSKSNLLMEQTTANSLEDLENVMKRVAKSISSVKTFSESAEVGRIIETETFESLRRSSKYNFGITFGYLFPQTGYDNDFDKTFVFNTHFDYELPEYAIGLMFGLRRGFAANIYGNYLFSKTDFCPYVGGSFGFHWVTHNAVIYYSNDKKSSDGFEIGFASGLRLFHTYDFQVVLNLEYIITFNDYNDKAVVFTIGIL
ncbi:MAG: hypothetical protein HZC46_08855 [Ignavibacterium album]|uniref:hypothetical protein n=1 Tax=Ignavibacterium album TaxID=591197 RepID=UPI0026F112E5|nr:hypothetical protein [Ignavibacterium album]MBI5662243.1 hypothetical protein [Ignavibacterium album]